MKPIYEVWGFELFDKIWSSTNFDREQTEIIANALNRKDKILDLGTGIGNVAKRLVEMGKLVYCIDINRKSLDYVRRKIGSSKFHPVLINAQNMDYNEEFDGVFCASNMAYFDDIDIISRGVYRALRQGGLFVVTGFEGEHMQRWGELTGEESRKAIKERLTLSDDELKLLKVAGEPSQLTTIDSSQRTLESLLRTNFNILRRQSFYHNTCYFILARKE
ncbi:class I SAM-dependent methyltransferase [Candidatus Pacearchaeota archaeon]|nr:class I SAM-dependent methyltransferase [Candidatus Pacearchaeota archaeon]